MLLVKKTGAPKAPVDISLPHGAVLTVRTLDAFEHRLVNAEARAELNAIMAGEPTQRTWASITPERRRAIAEDAGKQAAIAAWMHAVLLATASATELTGVEAVEMDGDTIIARAPLEPSFETFELLFNDAGVEAVFRMQAFRTEELWSAEKNVSGPGPNGSGPEATNIAAHAETQAMPAPQAESEAAVESVPSSSTPPEPQTESLPEASSPAAAPGLS